jgi:hypothetical protein
MRSRLTWPVHMCKEKSLSAWVVSWRHRVTLVLLWRLAWGYDCVCGSALLLQIDSSYKKRL